MSPLISGLASVVSMVFNAASSGSTKSAATRRAGPDVDGGPSAVLTLSPQAEALAGLAGQEVASRSPGALERSPAGPGGPGGLTGRSAVSAQDFQQLLSRWGADGSLSAQLTAGFDVNQDGSITREEFLQGLAKTKGPESGSDFSQAVMQLMDRGGNADGRVTGQEFAAFAAAFVATAQLANRQGQA